MDVEATEVALLAGGAVSVGSLVLLQVQALKALFPRLAGQTAIAATLLVSLVSVAIAAEGIGVNWYAAATYIYVYIGTISVFVSAVSQYAFLFKQSVPGLPPRSDETVINVDTVPTEALEREHGGG